ncbi:hypothetical protein [Actinomadura sp. BRA 177]|nr:hypothetical protein [Actinomadura sp. BRA 177]
MPGTERLHARRLVSPPPYSETSRVRPPREGMRPGTAAGIPQTPF